MNVNAQIEFMKDHVGHFIKVWKTAYPNNDTFMDQYKLFCQNTEGFIKSHKDFENAMNVVKEQ